jgi:hypothetical protein
MAICKDPSVTFLNRFGYNVVKVPRTGVEPMDVLGKDESMQRIGRLSSVWKTSSLEPKINPPSTAADVNGQKSDNLDLSVGLKVLANVLSAFGAAVPSLGFAYKHARKVQFGLANVISVSVDPLEVGNYLASGDLDTLNDVAAHFFTEDDAQAFVITEVLKSDTVVVTAKSNSGTEVKVDIPAIQQAVGINIGVNTSGSDDVSVTYKGRMAVTFGFKAFAIAYVDGRWRLHGVQPTGELAFEIAAADEQPTPVIFNTMGLVRI